MTIYFPDVSNYQDTLVIKPATVAVIAKATQGTWYTDASYTNFKAQAKSVGAVFMAYHFLEAGNAKAQAQHAFSVVGPGVPLMIDFEPITDANGHIIGAPSLADAVAFRDAYKALGGNVRAVYLPKWYWETPVAELGLGSPSLAPIANLALVSSEYVIYSDSGPGWDSYGGVVPTIWQYTNALSYNGQSVDFNAYKGTVAQFQALLAADPAPTPTPVPPVSVSPEDDDMPQQIEALADRPSGKYSYMFPKGQYVEVAFGVDTFGGSPAKLRVVLWTEAGADIHDITVPGLTSGVATTVLAFPNAVATYGMTVTREDSGLSPVGLTFK